MDLFGYFFWFCIIYIGYTIWNDKTFQDKINNIEE